MKYIGNKTRLLNFIESSIKKSKIKYSNVFVADLFSGTGSVSNFFLNNSCRVYSCDNMTYSIAEQYRINYFNTYPKFEEIAKIIGGSSLDDVLNYLNSLSPKKGYFYDNYAPSGKYKRQYFSDKNAMKIDSIREKIEEWRIIIPHEKYMFLLGILMCSADKISNTSGTYGAYLKIWRSMALKDLFLEKPNLSSKGCNYIYKNDVLDFVKQHKGFDIVYLDPPYNRRQYASNFHVLENIVVFDKQELCGKTGLREYDKQKSDYCIKSKVYTAFKNLIDNVDSKFIIMSYSTEGLLSENEILEVLNTRGETTVYRYDYRRFKTNAWTEGQTNLQELLFVCIVKFND